MKWSSWSCWSVIWLVGTIVPSLGFWAYTGNKYSATLIPSILFWVYAIGFLNYLEHKKIGLRHILLEKIENYDPTNKVDIINLKLTTMNRTFATMTSVSFTLMVFSLGFIYAAEIDLGFDANTAIIFGMISSLTIAGIVFLLGLDYIDIAVDPSFTADFKWQMRKFAVPNFIRGRDFLIFALVSGVSLIHPLLTLIAFSAYVISHNIFLFERLN